MTELRPPVISGAEFARLYAMRASSIAWLMGAGCSAAAGIPTANTMIIDFKLRLFCAATQIPRNQIDSGDPLWVERINRHFNGRLGFPSTGDPTEYGIAFEATFPNPRDRRAYIEQAVRLGVPSFGHRVLASLISSGQVPCLFTPNFDPLIERATVVTDELQPTDKQAHLTVAALDSADRAERCLRDSSWPLLTKLHGDYQSDQLKNVADELKAQDTRMRRVLAEGCRRFGLLVIGYSARDSSVMAALREAAVAEAFPAGLFWAVRPGSRLPQSVLELIEVAQSVGIEAQLVEVANFDELGGEIERQVTFPPALAAHIRAARVEPRVTPVTMPTVEAGKFPVLRCTALPILEMPSQARLVATDVPLSTPEARRALKDAGVRGDVAAVGQRIAAFGRDTELLAGLEAYRAKLDGTIELDPQEDSWALGLLYSAVVRALARGRPLRTRLRSRGHFLVVSEPGPDRPAELAARDREALGALARAYGSPVTGTVPNLGLASAEAVQVRLDYKAGNWWCVFDPHTWIEHPHIDQPQGVVRPAEGRPAFSTPDIAGDWRRERWARRYNRTWAQIIDAWAKILAPFDETRVRAFKVEEGEGLSGEFTLGKVTGWSRPAYRRSEPTAEYQ